MIPIYDAGDEKGVLYIMMRLVEGTDMRTLIADRGALDPLRAARIVQQVGGALDAAHSRGMLHRDIKPSNVLLARRDHVYLSDFGLAKETTSVEGLTRDQTIIGRVEYVSPEQILNERVDARSDVYALGCLLYEGLTGEPPYARWTQGPAALAHLDAPRPSPSALRPDLPRGFDDVVHRAMAVDPNERYPSAGDLGQAALAAAGAQARAGGWSVVATGRPPRSQWAAPRLDGRQSSRGGSRGSSLQSRRAGVAAAAQAPEALQPGSDTWRWAVALVSLAILAVGMVAALHGISTL